MDNKTDYNIGDWIKDRPTGDIYEIIEVWHHTDGFIFKLGKRIDGRTNSIYSSIFNTTCTLASLQKYFISATSARVLYSRDV